MNVFYGALVFMFAFIFLDIHTGAQSKTLFKLALTSFIVAGCAFLLAL